MGFAKISVEPADSAFPERGPAIWPVAIPVWISSLVMVPQSHATPRGSLFIAVALLHLIAVAALLERSDPLNLKSVSEQAQLTVINIARPMQAVVEEQPEPMPSAVEDVSPENRPSQSPVEWSRVAMPRPKGGAAATSGGGGEDIYDATHLLAGQGATGPAGQLDGVADPYAGASPVWAGNGQKSRLLLIGAPNPAVLEQVRQLVARTFKNARGYARLKIEVDTAGVAVRVVQRDTDLPESVTTMLEENLIGRVVSGRKPKVSIIELPPILFA